LGLEFVTLCKGGESHLPPLSIDTFVNPTWTITNDLLKRKKNNPNGILKLNASAASKEIKHEQFK
jgi:hypothetical protein